MDGFFGMGQGIWEVILIEEILKGDRWVVRMKKVKKKKYRDDDQVGGGKGM